MNLTALQKLVEGAAKSAFDAHEDETGSLHRNFITSIAKRLDLPVPGHRASVVELDEYGVSLFYDDLNPQIRFKIDDVMDVSEAERFALAILWLIRTHGKET